MRFLLFFLLFQIGFAQVIPYYPRPSDGRIVGYVSADASNLVTYISPLMELPATTTVVIVDLAYINVAGKSSDLHYRLTTRDFGSGPEPAIVSRPGWESREFRRRERKRKRKFEFQAARWETRRSALLAMGLTTAAAEALSNRDLELGKADSIPE